MPWKPAVDSPMIMSPPSRTSSRAENPVAGNDDEYHARMAADAACRAAETFDTNRRPLLVGIALLPLSLMSAVADAAYELVVSCERTRRRVLLTVGALVALSHRPDALILLVNTWYQLQSLSTAVLSWAGWYQEHGTEMNLISAGLAVSSIAGAVAAQMWNLPRPIE